MDIDKNITAKADTADKTDKINPTESKTENDDKNRITADQIDDKNQITAEQIDDKNQITADQIDDKNQITADQIGDKNQITAEQIDDKSRTGKDNEDHPELGSTSTGGISSDDKETNVTEK